jgi:tight adherence protein B
MRLGAAFFAAVAAATAAALVGGVASARSSRRRRARPAIASHLYGEFGAGAGAAVGAWFMWGSVAFAVFAGAAFTAAARWRRLRRMAEAAETLRSAWPDGMRMVAAALRSGASVRSAIVDVAESGPDPLRAVLATFASRERVLGVAGALRAVAVDLADPVTDRVVEVLVLAHERGGSLVPGVLDELAGSLTADLTAAGEIRTQNLEQRLNARMVTIVPWAVLGLLIARDGPYRMFYTSPPGAVVLGLGGLLTLIGGALVGRLARHPAEPRVLAP